MNSTFRGARFHFENCVFVDGSVMISDCNFDSDEVSFAGSAVDGEAVCFSRCSFTGEELDFRDTQWNVSNAIIFHQCQFRSTLTGFSHTQWKAPTIAIQEPVAPHTPLQFLHGSWDAKRLLLKRFHHVASEVAFHDMNLNCTQVDMQLGRWQGQKFSLTQSNWNGDTFAFGEGNTLIGNLSMDENHFRGNQFSLRGLRSTEGSLALGMNEFHLSDRFDASRMILRGNVSVDDCTINAPSISWNKIHSESPEFRIQNTRFQGKRFRCAQSNFANQTFSLARSNIDAQTIDFRVSEFQNMQTSFQGTTLRGKHVSFKDARFESPRVSFQRSNFEADKLSFDRCHFSNSRVSFWKSRFNGTRVYWRNAVAEDAELVFFTSLENHHFRDHNLEYCDFRGSEWGSTKGFFPRPCTADEKPMERTGRLPELVDLYQWIAGQYRYYEEEKRSDDFLLACRALERRIRRLQKSRNIPVPASVHSDEIEQRELPLMKEVAILLLLLAKMR